jgi:hypothetical protein
MTKLSIEARVASSFEPELLLNSREHRGAGRVRQPIGTAGLRSTWMLSRRPAEVFGY